MLMHRIGPGNRQIMYVMCMYTKCYVRGKYLHFLGIICCAFDIMASVITSGFRNQNRSLRLSSHSLSSGSRSRFGGTLMPCLVTTSVQSSS